MTKRSSVPDIGKSPLQVQKSDELTHHMPSDYTIKIISSSDVNMRKNSINLASKHASLNSPESDANRNHQDLEKQSVNSDHSSYSERKEGKFSKRMLKKAGSNALAQATERKLQEENRKQMLISSLKQKLFEFTPTRKLATFQSSSRSMFKPFLSSKNRQAVIDEAADDTNSVMKPSKIDFTSPFVLSGSVPSSRNYGPRKSAVTVENALSNLTIRRAGNGLWDGTLTNELNISTSVREAPPSLEKVGGTHVGYHINELRKEANQSGDQEASQFRQKKKSAKKRVKLHTKIRVNSKTGMPGGKESSQYHGTRAATSAQSTATIGKMHSVPRRREKRLNTPDKKMKVTPTASGSDMPGRMYLVKKEQEGAEMIIQSNVEVDNRDLSAESVKEPSAIEIENEMAKNAIDTNTSYLEGEKEEGNDAVHASTAENDDKTESIEVSVLSDQLEQNVDSAEKMSRTTQFAYSPDLSKKQNLEEGEPKTDSHKLPAEPLVHRIATKSSQFESIVKRAKEFTPPKKTRSRMSGDLVETRSYTGSFFAQSTDNYGAERPQHTLSDTSRAADGKTEGAKLRGFPMSVLPKVTPSTQNIVMMHETLTEHKSAFELLPVRKLLSTMSYDELCRRKDSKLTQPDFNVNGLVEECEEDVGPSNSYESVSTLSSTEHPAPIKVRGPINDQMLMSHFCHDWESPRSAIAPIPEEHPQPEAVERRHTFSETMDMMDDDALYDVTFTFKLPKRCPFDLNASLSEVRLSCVQKWLTKIANAHYKSFFESELLSAKEKNINDELMAKLVSLQKRLRVCNTCNPPTKDRSSTLLDSSKSTYSYSNCTKENLELSSTHGEACGEGEGLWQNDASESDTAEEMQLLYDMMNTYEQEEHAVGGLRNSVQKPDHLSENALPGRVSQATLNTVGDGCEVSQAPSITKITWSQHLSNRRTDIRKQLEKLIAIFEKKILEMKATRIAFEDNDVIGDDQDLHRSCHCYEDDALKSTLQTPPEMINHGQKLDDLCCLDRVSRKSVKRTHQSVLNLPEKQSTASKHERKLARQRLLMYLLGLRNTWLPEGNASELLEDPIEEKHPWCQLKRKDLQSGEKRLKKQNKLKYLPEYKHEESRLSRSTATEPDKNQRTNKKSSKETKEEVAFKCDCYCDRTSRYNAKNKEHFRPVLNENLWCLRSEPVLITRKVAKSLEWLEKLEKTEKMPPEERENPRNCPEEGSGELDNMKGWLADDDRHLLLLFNRPPLARLNREYYKIRLNDNIEDRMHNEPDHPNAILKERVQDIVLQVSKASASIFWKRLDDWYRDYRKCDKVWQLIDEFEKIDVKAMMTRDLKTTKDEMNRVLEKQKAKVKKRVELAYRENFLDNLRKLRAAYECRIQHRLEAKAKEVDEKKAFIVSCMLREAKEKFKPTVQKYKERCIEWMAEIQNSQNATSPASRQRDAHEISLIADRIDVAERTRNKLIGTHSNKMEEMEKRLREAIQNRDRDIDELNCTINNISTDIKIWERAVREILNSFKKFMRYELEQHPERAEYILNIEKLYQIQMDGLMTDATAQLEKVDCDSKTSKAPGEALQPTMEIKCPSHEIRYASQPTSHVGSSADTEIEKDIRGRKVADFAVDAMIRVVLPTPEVSIDGETNYEDLISPIESLESASEKSRGTREYDEQQTEPAKLAGDSSSDPSISVEEFTKRRTREMLHILNSKKPLMRKHVHL